MKSFLGNFYRHLAIFSGHTSPKATPGSLSFCISLSRCVALFISLFSIWPYYGLFLSIFFFSRYNSNINWSNCGVVVVRWIWTQGHKVVGADGTTELWWQLCLSIFLSSIFFCFIFLLIERFLLPCNFICILDHELLCYYLVVFHLAFLLLNGSFPVHIFFIFVF